MAIKVYVVDDSAVVRQTLMHLLQGDPEIELMGTAPNPLIAGPVIRQHRPDVLAILLTGMGDDGARGMKLLHDQGARTLAQDEQTCVVFGMPKQVIALGAVDEVLPITRVAQAIGAFDARG